MWHLGLTWGKQGAGGGAGLWSGMRGQIWGKGYLSQSRPSNNCNIYTSTWRQGSLTSFLTAVPQESPGAVASSVILLGL